MSELETYLSELNRKLEAAELADFCASMSDNFYHTSGRYAAAQRELSWLRSEIADTERLIALEL